MDKEEREQMIKETLDNVKHHTAASYHKAHKDVIDNANIAGHYGESYLWIDKNDGKLFLVDHLTRQELQPTQELTPIVDAWLSEQVAKKGTTA